MSEFYEEEQFIFMIYIFRSGGGGKGSPFGDNGDKKILLGVAAGLVLTVALLFEYGLKYKEISWKEFVQK